MKLTIQKILICALSLIFSIAACVCGMYMTILAHMQMGYRLLFCLFFILNPVLVIFMIRFMFKKPVPKEGTEGAAGPEKKKKWGFSRKEESVPAEPEYSQDAETAVSTISSGPDSAYSDGAYSGSTNSGSAYSDGNYSGNTNFSGAYGNSGYNDSSTAGSAEGSGAVQAGSEVQFGASSYAGELEDDIDLSGSAAEKPAAPVTEDSVAKFKKISLRRKKRVDE